MTAFVVSLFIYKNNHVFHGVKYSLLLLAIWFHCCFLCPLLGLGDALHASAPDTSKLKNDTSSSLTHFIPIEKPVLEIHGIRGFCLFEKPFKPTIIIDAGHGGKDPGSLSASGRKEKDVTLAAALIIAEEIKNTHRYHVRLTRCKDCFVPKRGRFQTARDTHADFFISIHADNHPSAKIRGLTIYTLSDKASDAEASRLAKQENKAVYFDHLDLVANEEQFLYDIIVDIAQNGSARSARQLAKLLHNELKAIRIGKLMKLRSADLAVLKAPEIPSLLVELGYLSNPQDEKLIITESYNKKLATSLIRALDKYYKKT